MKKKIILLIIGMLIIVGSISIRVYCNLNQSNYFSKNKILYANNSAYYVTFNANNGSGSMNNQKIPANTSVALNANQFTKRGYTFTGWNTKADGSGTSYADKANIKVYSNITLYAQWKANVYTVTADAEGGTIPATSGWTLSNDKKTATKKITYNTTYGTLPTPVRDGYIFEGWYTNESTPKQVTESTHVYTIVNYTMHAYWKERVSTITFNGNGGTGAMASQGLKGTVNVTLNANQFTKRGYTFTGWNTKADGSGTSYADKANIKVYSNITLYAQWKANVYTVTADAEGGTIPATSGWTLSNDKKTATKKITYNTTYGTLPTPVRDGYIFEGWYTNESTPKRVTEITSVYTIVNYTMHAHWKERVSTITFNGNGSDNSMSNQTISAIKKEPLKANIFKRTGYTFTGWNTKADGSGTSYADKANIKVYSNITLYAQWKANVYTVTADAEGGTIPATSGWTLSNDKKTATKKITYNTTYGTLPAPVRNGYIFMGWYTSVSGGKLIKDSTKVYTLVNYTMHAYWIKDDFAISFNPNGGSGAMGMKKISITTLPANVYTRKGYTFTGWNTKADGSGTSYADKAKVKFNSQTTLYAQWKANTFTIKYNGNGSTGGSVASHTCTYGEACTLKANEFIRSGYTFVGWKKENNSTILKANSSIKNVATSGIVTYYAEWKEKEVTITFNSNYGTNTSRVQKITSETQTMLEANSFSRTNYVFSGWNTKADGSGTSYDNKSYVTLKKDLTLYAQWVSNTQHKISFNLNGGGRWNNSSVKVAYGQTMPAINTTKPIRSGFIFIGWYDNKNPFVGTKYYNADGTSSRNYDKTNDTTLYAGWEQQVVSYSSNSLKYDIKKYFTGRIGKATLKNQKKTEEGMYLITYIWAKNPYEQLKVAIPQAVLTGNADKGMPTKTMADEINKKGYQTNGYGLGLVGINASAPITGYYDKLEQKYRAPNTWDGQPAISTFVYEGKVLRRYDKTNAKNDLFKNENDYIFDALYKDINKDYPNKKPDWKFLSDRYVCGLGSDNKMHTFISNTLTNSKRDQLKNNQDQFTAYKKRENEIVEQIEEAGIRYTYGFAPVLIENGEITEFKNSYEPWYTAPDFRSAFCQIDDNHFIFITGTSVIRDSGLSIRDLADIMKNLGCKTGYNFDGGDSRVNYYKAGSGKYTVYHSDNYSTFTENSISFMEYKGIHDDRKGADILYFVEAKE